VVDGTRGLFLEASSEIELRPGERHEVVLESSGSTGYTWEFEVDGPPDVVQVRLNQPAPPSDSQRSGLANYSVEHTYAIEALAPGSVEIRFVFRRPWQKGAPPAQTRVFRVKVVT
jgi:predicted secreted protein